MPIKSRRFSSGCQQMMSSPYHGINRGGYAGAGNQYPQGGQPYAGPSAQRGVNPQFESPRYAGSGYPPAPAGNYGPNSAAPISNDVRSLKLNQVIQRYEINPQFAARLQALGNCEIVILCDDSGSMNAQLHGTNQTRWDELKSVGSLMVVASKFVSSMRVAVCSAREHHCGDRRGDGLEWHRYLLLESRASAQCRRHALRSASIQSATRRVDTACARSSTHSLGQANANLPEETLNSRCHRRVSNADEWTLRLCFPCVHA